MTLLNDNIQMEKFMSFNKPIILIIGNNYNSTIIKYEIIIGNYKISIDLLNLLIKAP